MSVELKQIEIDEPVEFELTLRLTRKEALDLFTRVGKFPYSTDPTNVVQDIWAALSSQYGRTGPFNFETDYIYPKNFCDWYIKGIEK